MSNTDLSLLFIFFNRHSRTLHFILTVNLTYLTSQIKFIKTQYRTLSVQWFGRNWGLQPQFHYLYIICRLNVSVICRPCCPCMPLKLQLIMNVSVDELKETVLGRIDLTQNIFQLVTNCFLTNMNGWLSYQLCLHANGSKHLQRIGVEEAIYVRVSMGGYHIGQAPEPEGAYCWLAIDTADGRIMFYHEPRTRTSRSTMWSLRLSGH